MQDSTTRVKIEKINNLFQVDINRLEQGCAAHYEQYCQHVVTALFNCNNMVDNLFIVGRTTYCSRLSISTWNNLCGFSRVDGARAYKNADCQACFPKVHSRMPTTLCTFFV